jgi:hypothetical protein
MQILLPEEVPLILKLSKEVEINHHRLKEHTKISKFAKFGCEML